MRRRSPVPRPPRPAFPSVVCANFTWDWIYRDYREQPGVASSSRPLARATRCASAAWRLPIHGGFETIRAHRRHPVRRAARPGTGRPTLRADAARAAAGSAAGAGLVRRLRPASAAARPPRLPARLGHRRVVARRANRCRCRQACTTSARTRCTTAACATRISSAAVDVVITKPGYGIISDCVANGTAMLYTSRGRFAEYDVMVAGDAAAAALPVPRARGVRGRQMERGTARAGGTSARRRCSRGPMGREVAAATDCRTAQCALTVVTSDQMRGKFTFSIETGCRSACARNAGRSRSALKPM